MRCTDALRTASQPKPRPSAARLFAPSRVRTGQRRLADDPEVPSLVAAYARAEVDATRAAASMERLVQLCRPAAEQIARGYLRSEDDVQDVAQESLILLARYLPQLREPGAFPAWFAQLAHNAARQWLRRERDRRSALSLDGTTRAGSPASDFATHPLDPADRAALDALNDVENRATVGRFLKLLPGRQRAALSLTYLDGLTHERIGREIGVTPRAVEGLAYRGLRRLQAIAAQCTDEPEPMGLTCASCRRPLVAVLIPGDGPDRPFVLRVRCAGCTPAGHWTHSSSVPFERYALLDDAWERSGVDCLEQALAWAEQRRRGVGPHCRWCATPLLYEPHWWVSAWRPRASPCYMLSWRCPSCRIPYSPMHVQLGNTAATTHPQWNAFKRTARYLAYEPERIVQENGEDVLVVTAWDVETGRQGTLRVACDALAVRRVDITPA